VRGIVELFRLVNHEKELHREILAFSISHDHETVKIYGHYPVIDGNETTFYRHPIRKFDFTELDGKEKWTSYTFTTSVYNIWMPGHLKKICSVINMLSPDMIEASQQPGPGVSRATHRPYTDIYIASSPPLGHHHSFTLYQYTPILSPQPLQALTRGIWAFAGVRKSQSLKP
jgi:hypothetical protein